MIKESTRAFAWVWMVITGLILAGGVLHSDPLFLALLGLIVVSWILLLVRPVIGWWLLVPSHLYLLAGFTRTFVFHPPVRNVVTPQTFLMLVAMFVLQALPLLVLSCDSPWRWKKIRRGDVLPSQEQAYAEPAMRSQIRLTTRFVAWIFLLLICLHVFPIPAISGGETPLILEHVSRFLLICGWAALLRIPRLGWWVIAPLYAIQFILLVVFEIIPSRPSTWSLGALIYIAWYMIIPTVIPLLVLVFDSPWRWRRVREAESTEG